MEHCARCASVYNLRTFKYLLIGKIDIYIDTELVSIRVAEF